MEEEGNRLISYYDATVEVSVNSIPFDTFTADGSGWIAFDYTDGFSQDTVTIELEVISTAVEEPEVIEYDRT
ncbi:MAG: hypothetical protein K8S15_13305 [Candidatus Aegiribacteria sp.]|nr:hypothetical protein [Candidatus Aegiribacteria sp.]